MFVSGIADEAGKPIDVQIKAHQEIGLKHIEIRNVDSVNLTDVPDEKFDEIYDQVTAAGLTVSCFASQLCNWARPVTNDFNVDVEELQRAIPRMHKFDCKFIRCMSYPNDKENPIPEDEWKTEVFRRMTELAKIAEDGNVILVHENCDGYGGKGPDQTLELLDTVGSDNLKLVFDTGNTVFHGQDSYDFYSKVQDHVIYIHIKDGRPEDGKTIATYPGEGNGAVREICKAHLAKDPEVGFSIEPHLAAAVHLGKEADDEQAYKIYVEYGKRMVALLDEVK